MSPVIPESATTEVPSAKSARKWPVTLLLGSVLLEFAALTYEQVVIVPNYFTGDPRSAAAHYAELHSTTNPVAFHGLVSGMVIVGLVAMLLDYRRHDIRRVWITLVSLVATAGLTGVAVTLLNPRLFFGAEVDSAEALRGLVVSWSLLNLVRIALLATAAWQVWQLRLALERVADNDRGLPSAVLGEEQRDW